MLSKLPTTTRERDQTLMPRQMTPMRAFQPDYISPPGETLADMLEQSGMTQTELAQRLGVDPAAVRSWEAGLHAPQPTNRAAVLRLERRWRRWFTERSNREEPR